MATGLNLRNQRVSHLYSKFTQRFSTLGQHCTGERTSFSIRWHEVNQLLVSLDAQINQGLHQHLIGNCIKSTHRCNLALRHQLRCTSRDEEHCIWQNMKSSTRILHVSGLLHSLTHHPCFGLTCCTSECNTLWIECDGAQANSDHFALAHCLNATKISSPQLD